MDAVLPPEDELAALRRRAYGPDADIGGDPRAQARLADLEREHAALIAGVHAACGGGREGAVRAGGEPAAERSDARPSATAGPHVQPDTAVEPTSSTADAGPSGWRGGPRLPWLVASVAAVAAVVALGVHVVDAITRPRVEARLVALDQPLAGDVPPGLGHDELMILEATEPDFVSYGGYGALRVWSTPAPHDWRCLAIVFGRSLWRFNCTATTIDTIADVDILSHLLPPDAPGGPVPEWSTIRFVLHDEVVDVYIGRNADRDG